MFITFYWTRQIFFRICQILTSLIFMNTSEWWNDRKSVFEMWCWFWFNIYLYHIREFFGISKQTMIYSLRLPAQFPHSLACKVALDWEYWSQRLLAIIVSWHTSHSSWERIEECMKNVQCCSSGHSTRTHQLCFCLLTTNYCCSHSEEVYWGTVINIV